MDLKVEIDAQAVNEMVSQAILNSTLGGHLRQAIDSKVSELSRNYNNPITPIIEKIVAQEIYQVIQKEYTEAIREKVREQLTDEVIGRVMSAAINAFLDKS